MAVKRKVGLYSMILPLKLPVRIKYPYGVKDSAYASGHHTGIDIITNGSDWSILAPVAGKVIARSYDANGWGNYLVLSAGVYELIFAHMASVVPAVGQSLAEGAKIGIMGSTGHSSGPHLHFEVVKAGTWNKGIGRADVNSAIWLGIPNQDELVITKYPYSNNTNNNTPKEEDKVKGILHIAADGDYTTALAAANAIGGFVVNKRYYDGHIQDADEIYLYGGSGVSQNDKKEYLIPAGYPAKTKLVIGIDRKETWLKSTK